MMHSAKLSCQIGWNNAAIYYYRLTTPPIGRHRGHECWLPAAFRKYSPRHVYR